MKDCYFFYTRLQSRCTEILEESVSSESWELQARSHGYIEDLAEWIKVIDSRSESLLFRAALKEYQFSLLSVSQGQYRQAYMGLRLFLELAIATVFYSARELDLRIWMIGGADIKWSMLADSDQGVFSTIFAKAFFPDLESDVLQYGVIARKVYRECSEFVHANLHTHIATEKLSFDKELFEDWHQRADTIKLVVTFALCMRYATSSNYKSNSALESCILDVLGHIPAVNELFSLRSKVTNA